MSVDISIEYVDFQMNMVEMNQLLSLSSKYKVKK
jgi:hypothetical protein